MPGNGGGGLGKQGGERDTVISMIYRDESRALVETFVAVSRKKPKAKKAFAVRDRAI